MIIISNRSGQLGNQLFLYAHFIAFGKERRSIILNPGFFRYSKYFHHNRFLHSRLLYYPLISIFKLLRLINWRTSPMHKIIEADIPEYNFSEERFMDLPQNLGNEKALTFCFGRFFRDFAALEKWQTFVRKSFEINPKFRAELQQLKSRLTSDRSTTVGVHIRRGDYKKFADGRYYYSIEEYLSAMKSLQSSHPEKKLRFLVCSDEDLEVRSFPNVDVQLGPGSEILDLYLLSECDYIMGPPSTYSSWASFFGEKPICKLRRIEKKLSLEDFKYQLDVNAMNFTFS